MSTKISPEQLAAIPLFGDLTQAEREELMPSLEELSFSKGDVVLRAGDVDAALYVVLTGEIEIELALLGIESAPVASVGPNGVFGETSFFNPAPHSATARCRQPSTLLRLRRAEFDRLLSKNSLAAFRLSAKAAQILASRLQATDRWVSELLGEQRQSIVASWRRFREGLGGSFDIPHGFVHPY